MRVPDEVRVPGEVLRYIQKLKRCRAKKTVNFESCGAKITQYQIISKVGKFYVRALKSPKIYVNYSL